MPRKELTEVDSGSRQASFVQELIDNRGESNVISSGTDEHDLWSLSVKLLDCLNRV